jgi:hypothetical protein
VTQETVYHSFMRNKHIKGDLWEFISSWETMKSAQDHVDWCKGHYGQEYEYLIKPFSGREDA